RSELEKQKEENGIYWLHDKLKALDPIAAEKIDARNFRRTIRALEVIMTTGKKFSEQRGQVDSPYHLITIGLTRPRAELYARVDARIEAMFANGFLDEVKRLLESGYSSSLPTMSAIGYRECVEVLEGKIKVEEVKQLIGRATRIFVRRQANWFKESDPNISWFKVEDGVSNEIEKNIRQAVDF
ncbi:MAG: tRNA dimethylallyltransferase, partial [Chloroflexota bacterium]